MTPLVLTLLWAALANAKCYEPSTPYQPPKYDRNDALLQHAFAVINTELVTALAAPEFAPTSFSVEITSSEESLWSQHHTARERNTSRPDIPEVNGDALYRIASITKTFTVLGILQQHEEGNLSLDDPVGKYIEEFNGPQDGSIPWKEITLRTLASQLSGIPREFAQGDLLNTDKWPVTDDLINLGLPPVSRKDLKDLIACDEYSPNYNVPCNAEDLIETITSKAPLFAPKQKSTYSNVAFEILGLVIARVTNQTYESYMEEAIFQPLDMKKSSFATPPDSDGVIPINPQYWDVNAGIQNPTGGIYSSSTDLSKYLRYILKNYNGITKAANWLHPVSPSRGLNSFYGMPWEIFQTDRVLEESKRTISFRTKSGGLPGYTSMILAIPELDLGITILVAGPSRVFFTLLESVTKNIVRAADKIATRELHDRYAGTYASSDPDLNSTITLVADHRGLVVTQLISNSSDILNSELMKYFGARSGEKWYAQLTPTLLYVDEKSQSGERWRMLEITVRDEEKRNVWDDFCAEDYDHPLYAGLPANEAVFWDEGDNGFQSVHLTGFRVNLTRVTQDGEAASQHGPQDIMEL